MKRKLLSLTLVLALVVSMLPMGAFAAAIAGIVYGPATSTVAGANVFQDGATGVLPVATFTPGANVPAGAKVKLTFPAGTALSGIANTDFEMVQLAGGGAAGAVTAANATFDAATRTIVLTVPAAARTATSAGNLIVSTSATYAGSEIVNPTAVTTAGVFTVDYDAAGDGTYEDTGSISNVAVTVGGANLYTSVVSVDKTSVTADGSKAKVTAYIYDVNHNLVGNTTKVYIDTNRGSADIFTADAAYTISPAVTNTTPRYITTVAGKVEFSVSSSVAGTAKIGLALGNAANAWPAAGGSAYDTYLQRFLAGTADSAINITSLGIVGGTTGPVDVKFTADTANKIEVFSVTPYDVKDKEISVGNANQNDGLSFPLANNLQYFEVKFKVATTSNVPVAGKKVTFTSNDSGVTFNETEKTTDAAGVATVKVFANKSGFFEVSGQIDGSNAAPAKTDNATAGTLTSKLRFLPSGATSIELSDDDNQVVAKDRSGYIFEFKLFDSVGNSLDLTSGVDSMADASVVKQPSGSDISVKILGSATSSGKAQLEVSSSLSKEGAYTLRASLKNGKKADVNFTVKEQGKITGIVVAYDESFIQQGAPGPLTNKPSIKRVDAAGVKSAKLTASSSNISVTSSDASLIKVDTDGKAQVVTNEKEDIGKSVTITFIDKNNNVSTTAELKIAGKIASVKAVAPTTAQVGKDAAVEVQVVDSKGNITAGMPVTSKITTEVIILEKPAGATIGYKEDGTFSDDLHDLGKATIKFNSNKDGAVKARIIVKDNTSSIHYSTEVSMTFGAAATVANKTLVLNMGSTTGFMNNGAVKSDLAPFIKDGRAFVPVSFIAAQLGGTAEFTKNAAGLVDTVTVKAGTTTVTMTIGSTTIKVVKDGKESTVTSDVAPFIKSGRTVLPFRAIAEAMGAKVSFGPETGAVEWVKFEM